MDNNQMMDPSVLYGIPPCAGPNCADQQRTTIVGNTPGNPNIPTLEEIANFNYLDAQQRREFQQQLQQAGSNELQTVVSGQGNTQPVIPQSPNRQGGSMQGTGNMTPPSSSTGMVPSQNIRPGGSISGLGSPQPGLQPITPTTQPMPITAESLQYMNGFLRTQIGRIVQVQFLVGTSTLVDRMGMLLAVGANYILLNEIETDDILACDFYNIKFVRFYY
jgi:hypothetical protein